MGPGKGAGRAERVAVIDDEPLVRDIIARGLRASYEVETFGAAREFFEALGEGRRFGVIICDLMMPEVSGRAIYEEIRERWPGQQRRLIFVSGLSEAEARLGPLEGLDNDMIEKPFQLAELRRLVQEIFERLG